MKNKTDLPKFLLLAYLIITLLMFGCKRDIVDPSNDDKNDSTNFALEFDGETGYVQFRNDESLNPRNAITISMWLFLSEDVNCNSENNWRSLINKGFSWVNLSGYDVVLEQDRKFAWSIATVGGPIRYRIHDYLLPVGRWSHLTFVYDGSTSTANIYANGKRIPGDYESRGAGDIIPNYNNLSLNIPAFDSCPNGVGNFPGSIDELSIWNIALTQTEIENIMIQPPNGGEAGLISCWNFDVGKDGSIAYDIMGQNYGILYYGVWWTTR